MRTVLIGIVALIAFVAIAVSAACETATPTSIPVPTIHPTYTPAPNPTPTVMPTPTMTPMPTATQRPLPPTATPRPTPMPTPAPILSADDLIPRAESSTVRINVGNSQGTGFFIDELGYILTSSDLIPLDATDIIVTHPSVGSVAATVLGRDARKDVALLRVQTDVELTPLNLEGDSFVPPQETAVAIGYLGGTSGQGLSTAAGRILAHHEREEGLYFEVGTKFGPGLSGAPIMNLTGELIAVASLRSKQVLGTAREDNGVSVAISSVVPQLDALKCGAQLFLPNPLVDAGRNGLPPPLPPFPRIFDGRVTLNGQSAPIGTKVQARIGQYVTDVSSVVTAGLYPFLTVQPPDERNYTGEPVQFYIDGFLASQTFPFSVDESAGSVSLDLSAASCTRSAAPIPATPAATPSSVRPS